MIFCLELLISRAVVSLSSTHVFNLEAQCKALHMPPRALNSISWLLSSCSPFFLGISFSSMPDTIAIQGATGKVKSSKEDIHETRTHLHSALWVTLCPGRSPGSHTVLKKTGQIGREIWEFNSLLVSSAHGQVYIAADIFDIKAKPDKSIIKDSSSPGKASYKYRCIPRRFRRNSMCAGKGIINNSHQNAGLTSTVGQCKGHKRRVASQGLGLTLPSLGTTIHQQIKVA